MLVCFYILLLFFILKLSNDIDGYNYQKRIFLNNNHNPQSMALELTNDDMCFACGKKNDIGLKLDLTIKGKTSSAEFIPDKKHQGYANILHGGIISTILDEAMVNLAFRIGLNAVTSTLEVKFIKPATVGEKLLVNGEILEEEGRVVKAKSELKKEDGTLIAEASGVLIKIK